MTPQDRSNFDVYRRVRDLAAYYVEQKRNDPSSIPTEEELAQMVIDTVEKLRGEK